MFGIDDPMVWMAYLLCLAATAACIVYGVRNWNRGDDELDSDDKSWAKHEHEVEEDL
jgi:hypothetical protein